MTSDDDIWVVSPEAKTMTSTSIKPRMTSFAPQFLVADLARSIGRIL